MNHELAEQTKTIDRYLMNDLSGAERSALEAHIFECPDCAARVKEGFVMVDALKEVLHADAGPAKDEPAWRGWLRPFTLGPALAALGLGAIVGYQNLVTIPAILRPQVLASTTLVAATRGTTQSLAISPGASFFGATFQVFSPAVEAGYVCEFVAGDNRPLTTMDCGQHPAAEFRLNLLLPSALFPPGMYTMILRPASDKHAEVSRYFFAVTREGVPVHVR